MSGVGINLRYFEGLGAVAVSSGLADFYNNIATGLTDGVIVWPEAIISFKLYEVGPYLIDVRLGAVSSVAISANERTWDQLPDEVRRALLAAAEVYRDELALETVRRSTRAMESFEALGGGQLSRFQTSSGVSGPPPCPTWLAPGWLISSEGGCPAESSCGSI